jgi:hypothetical protein
MLRLFLKLSHDLFLAHIYTYLFTHVVIMRYYRNLIPSFGVVNNKVTGGCEISGSGDSANIDYLSGGYGF